MECSVTPFFVHIISTELIWKDPARLTGHPRQTQAGYSVPVKLLPGFSAVQTSCAFGGLLGKYDVVIMMFSPLTPAFIILTISLKAPLSSLGVSLSPLVPSSP